MSDRCSRIDWVAAALEAMASQGLAGVAVEPLARKLGVTKGSFYWHFTDKQELMKAAVQHWEHSYTEQIIKRLEAIADPRERLRRLISQVSSGGDADRVHLAISGESHPTVKGALARVTQRRLHYLEKCFSDLGRGHAEAKQAALLAYAAYVGLVHLRLEAPKSLPGSTEFRAYVDYLTEKLVS